MTQPSTPQLTGRAPSYRYKTEPAQQPAACNLVSAAAHPNVAASSQVTNTICQF